MDKLEIYRSYIQIVLEKYAQFKTQNTEAENQLFFDPVRNHYQLMRVGWKDLERIYYIYILILKMEKFGFSIMLLILT